MNQLSEEEKKELLKNQVFLCIDTYGYMRRLRPLSRLEKQEMYLTYFLVIQLGNYCRDMVKIWFSDKSDMLIAPNKLRFGKPYFISRRAIVTISLEPK